MKNQSGLAHLLPILILAIILAGVATYLTANPDSAKTLQFGQVLSRGSDSDDSSGSSTESDDNDDDDQEPNEEDESDEFEEENETETSSSIRQERERTEIRLSEGERIRVRTKDGETRVDITSGGVRVKLEYEEDRVRIKAQREDGTEEELEDETIFKIEERLSESGIRLATGEGKFRIQTGTSLAETKYPLSIDLATNTLTITTPSGTKEVAVLPDQAVKNLLAANLITKIGAPEIAAQIESGELTNVSELVSLAEKNGQLVYEIDGLLEKRLIGLIPVEIKKEVTISAETGEVVGTNQSFLNQILEVFSF